MLTLQSVRLGKSSRLFQPPRLWERGEMQKLGTRKQKQKLEKGVAFYFLASSLCYLSAISSEILKQLRPAAR